MSAAQTGRTHDLHPTASKKPKNPLTRGRRPHMTQLGHPQVRETNIGPRGVAPRSNSMELAGGLRAVAVRYSAVTCPRLVLGDAGACDSFLLHGYRQSHS